MPSDVIIFTGDRDTPGKHDYTRGFKPWAEQFAKFHNVPKTDIVAIDLSLNAPGRAKQVLAAIDARERLTTVAFLCHGLEKKIQLGFSTENVGDLANAIAAKTTWGNIVTIPTYACSTGKNGDGGFADALRDGLCRASDIYCRVDSHTTAGSATTNPYVSRFDGMGSWAGGTGGSWLVAPKSTLWKGWRAALAKRGSTLPWRFPYMSVAEIHQELLEGTG